MKNFDEARNERRATEEERTFVLAGETFVLKPSIKPEWMIPVEDLDGETNTSEDFVNAVDLAIQNCLLPDNDAAARWRALRDDELDPLSNEDMRDVLRWIFEVSVGRPTGPREDSSAPRGTPGGTSTESSLRLASEAG